MLGYGYCRYSSHMQDEKSIEQQKMEIEEYARKNNIQIVDYYTDEAKSGTKNESIKKAWHTTNFHQSAY